ncbi:MAG: hypothetical protein JO033_00110, partial [Acidobacteriaceae bacterium]|nr:hypothetical protein [Acidobacteriaceae bacterium]
SREEVLTELDKVLGSHQFHTSKKCSRFLRHIVEAAVDGRADCLKERTLGVDVFNRRPHYDTNQDPIVRGTAGEVRKRLAQYYLATGNGELRFSLPPGSYVPEVHYAALDRPKRLENLVQVSANAPQHRNWIRIAVAGLVLSVVLAICLWLVPSGPTALDRFWSPVEAGKTVLVCIGQPQLYTFHSDTARALNSWFASEGEAHVWPSPIGPVPVNEIVPMWDTAIALADAQAFSRLANLFVQKRLQIELRGERSVSLADLRGKPSVFIGAFDNHWALNLTTDLRFYFDTDQQKHQQIIRDRQSSAARDWKLVDAWPPGKDISEDYALVTRVVNRTTERAVVILGGIAQYGTEAAAELVTNPAYFERVLQHAPRDWYRKNIQVVLSTKVVSGVSGPPSVLAAYFW